MVQFTNTHFKADIVNVGNEEVLKPPRIILPSLEISNGSLIAHKKALRNAHYSAFLEENKNNPRFIFSTVAKLTEPQLY